MSKRIALTLFAVLVLTLSACTRTASTPFPATATVVSNFPAVPAATSMMKVIEDAGTQTAIAQTGTPQGGLPALSTPIPGAVATFTPPADATSAPVNVTPGATTAAETPLPAASTAVPTVTSAPAVPLSKPATYTLQTGEFPYCIARRYNIDPDELLTLNGLSGSGNFDPGTVLKIPASGNPFPGSRSLLKHPATYSVLSGETIYAIACKFGDVDPLAIATNNGLTTPYTLTVGTSLNIP